MERDYFSLQAAKASLKIPADSMIQLGIYKTAIILPLLSYAQDEIPLAANDVLAFWAEGEMLTLVVSMLRMAMVKYLRGCGKSSIQSNR